MKKRIAILFFITLGGISFAFSQQTVQYSQFMLNGYGYSPASIGQTEKLDILMGRRTQWTGFDNAPQSTFLSVNRAFGKRRARYGWHGAGVYIEADQAGLYSTKAVYGTYAYHLKFTKKYTTSFGVSVGGKSVGLEGSAFNPADPALTLYPAIVLVYPDIIPGVRYYSAKTFVDLSAKNIYKNKIQRGGKQIGTTNNLKPHISLTMGKKIKSKDYYYTFIPAIHINYFWSSLPSVDANLSVIMNKRLALGVSYRYNDAVIAMMQLRIAKNILIGLSYDYVVSKMHAAAADSREIMLGISPLMFGEDAFVDKQRIAQCPSLDF